MGGLAGVLHSDPAWAIAPEDLAPMAVAIGSRSSGEVQALREGPLGLLVKASPGTRAGIATRTVSEATVATAFHGILYEAPGMSPGSLTDPATCLLDLYLAQGTASIGRLRGDFVLAIWDGRDRTLHLAVDPFRVHPLFYASDSRRILFGSKLRAVSTSPSLETRSLDPRAIVELVESSRISTPRTLFREIQKLPEGERLQYRAGRLSSERYWRLDYRHPDLRSRAALEEELRQRFADSIRTRLSVGELGGSVGAYLSGGIDSTTVVGVMTHLMGKPVHAFSIGFEEQGFNELGYARDAARAYGARHDVYMVTAEDTKRAIPLLLDVFDEPFGNASAVPAYYCARMAADHGIGTLYAGDGGDELFAGNEHYAARRVLEFYDRLPSPVRSFLVEPAATAAGSLLPWGPFRKAKKYVQRARIPYPDRLAAYSLYRVVPRERLFDAGFLRLADGYDPFESQAVRYFDALADRELDRQLYVDLRLLIADSDLFKVTRTAEAAGVGARFPFLDRPLAEFAASVPASVKMRGLNLRSFFKEAYADLLPPKTLLKKKHGFGLPIAGWLRADPELNELMRDLVSGKRALERGILSPSGTEELTKLHAEDTTSFFGTAMWNLMILELWLRRMEERDAHAVAFGPVPC